MDSGTIVLAIVLAVLIIAIALATRRSSRAEAKDKAQAKPAPEPTRAQPEAAAGPRAAPRAQPAPAPEAAEEPEAPEEEAAAHPPVDAAAAEATARRLAELRAGLAKTRGGFIAKIGALFGGKKKIDAATLDQLEEVLLTADIGVKTSQKIFTAVRQDLTRADLADTELIWGHIRSLSEKILEVGAAPLDLDRARPLVILMIGVNGVGKTTTIGKLASKYSAAGKKVLLAAGDTFRAAATEQLVIWGERTGCPVVRGKEGGDPSSVIFDAVKRAQSEGFDIVLADTAGRLHTKTNLMDELQKVRRVVGKALEGAPHETFLVVDSTTGQNAIAQAQMFQQAMSLTGIIMTKLDGTAKGGVILGISDELHVPVRYIGIGEKVGDLRDFDAADFVAALYEHSEAA
jgi:fused signal recognition particle receptor